MKKPAGKYTRLFQTAAIGLLCLFFSGACDRLIMKEEQDVHIVAKAGDEKLSHALFNKNYNNGGTGDDSTQNAKSYIETWAKESLFYQEALKSMDEEVEELDRRVEEYRRSLVNFAYQTKIIAEQLDTTVNTEEIQAYYDNHRENFILKENIVKVDYIKVPSLAPELEKIRKLAGSTKEKDQELLITLCLQNAEKFYINDSTWLFVDDIRKEIPQLAAEGDFRLVPGRTLEFNDDQYYYYLKIRDIIIKDAFSPVNFERANITKYILNRRKSRLISDYKRTLLEKARAVNAFELY